LRNPAGPLTAVERVYLAFAMTWAAGFVDLVGFVSLYGLYTSHMSGNTVAMARHISELDWLCAVRRCLRWFFDGSIRLLAMLAPFAPLSAIALYGAFRPLHPLTSYEW
jgi:hypothetical protein